MENLLNTQRFSRICIKGIQLVFMFAIVAFTLQKDNAKGMLTYKGNKKTYHVELKFAHFVTGPDSFDPNKKIRRLIFTNASMDGRIKSCNVMNCVDQYIEGVQVDLDATHRILFWVSLDGQLVQYSGTAPLEALTFSAQTDKRIAGKLKIDNASGGGPIIEVTFDALLLKDFAKHR